MQVGDGVSPLARKEVPHGAKKPSEADTRLLSEREGGIRLTELTDTLGISRRTLYYDIAQINGFLRETGSGKVEIVNHKLRISGSLGIIKSSDAAQGEPRYYSAAERRILTSLRIGLHDKAVTINGLIDLFAVSRNTVISDIRAIKAEISHWGIELASSIPQGYYFEGEEGAIRKYIWAQFQSCDALECLGPVREFLQRVLASITDNDLDFYWLARCIIKQHERDLQIKLFFGEDSFECLMIQVAWIRSLKGFLIKFSRDEEVTLFATATYRSVACSVEKLKAYSLAVPPEEMLYITSLLLGIKTADFSLRREEDAYVSELASRLVTSFERVGCLSFVDKTNINKQLSHHIRPLYYRMKYGITARNPLVDDIRRSYPIMFEFARRAATEAGLGGLSADEIAYITVYFSTDLDNKLLAEGDSSTSKVLVIGADNMSTATLVRERLSDACGMNFECSYANPDKVRRWELESYALVLSLVKLPNKMRSDNMVEITPMISEENKREIYSILGSNIAIARYDGVIDGILEIIGSNIEGCDEEALASNKLRFELFRFLDERDRGLAEPAPVSYQNIRLSRNPIRLEDGHGWRDAVVAGSAAIQSDAGGSSLLERMSNLMDTNKIQYYFPTAGVVVVHCPMQGEPEGRVCTSMVLSEEGVLFPDGKTAKIVICLSTINRYSHWGTLYELYNFFSDPSNVDLVVEEYAPRRSNASMKANPDKVV